MLGPKEADEMRRKLVLQLHDPAPLGQMGTALFVSESREVELGGFFGPITIELSVTQPLTAHGTLSGVSVPIDWNRAPVDTMTVKAAAETDEQLRTIYSPYHP
ncbi:MAG TPA: hypothetical protein EYN66_14630, partial [Myxococcales bacterium]|nr:hypothetical protein [Myxococcales bacterium]